LSASGGLVRLWRACPPLAGLSASGGLVRLWRIDVNTIYVFDMPLSPFNALDEGGLSGGF